MREFYKKVLGVVSAHTGFSEHQILHDRHEICTDARYLLVHFLSERLKCNEIVFLTKLSKQAVSQISNQYIQRAKFKRSLKIHEKKIGDELSECIGF